jgi:hypothetical protein
MFGYFERIIKNISNFQNISLFFKLFIVGKEQSLVKKPFSSMLGAKFLWSMGGVGGYSHFGVCMAVAGTTN